MSNISNFKANNSGLFARPNQFEVTFTNPRGTNDVPSPGNNKTLRHLTINCNATNVPGLTMIAGDKDAAYRSYVRQKVYDDITFTFLVNEEYKELEYFQNRMKLMVDPQTNRVGYYKNYKSTIIITNKNRQNTTSLKTTLFDAYPKRIEPLALDYSTNDAFMSLSVNVQYRTYKQEYFNPKVSAKVESEVEREVEPTPRSTNLKKVRKDESLETFRNRLGLQVPPEFRT